MILWSITIFGALLLLAHWISALMVMRRLRRAPEVVEPAAGWPRITLLRPVCGLDPQDRQTFASSFSQTYPDWGLIFCVARPDDPAIPVLRELIAAHPHVPAQLLIGETRLTGNPKLNNLLKGWDAATGSFVAMSDCNGAGSAARSARIGLRPGDAAGSEDSLLPENLAFKRPITARRKCSCV